MPVKRFSGSMVGVASLLLCAGAVEGQHAGHATASTQLGPGSGAAEAYTETISGTTVGIEMVPVPAGRVKAAAGGQEVAVGPFWIARTELLWDAYDVWVFGMDQGGQIATGKGEDAVSRPSKPYLLPGQSFGHAGRPALAMTFHGAEQFARWLSEKTGKKYRLPTEAEWEHACRAGAADPMGAALTDAAWFWDNSDEKTHAPGSRKANGFGVADMLGNVAEWVAGVDGEPVVKGGSYLEEAKDLSCGARLKQTVAWNATDPQLPKSRWWLPDAPFVGFRLLREP
ncbi:MAG: formylglycine-generating enzyme family protein [Gemmatimonadetes bacterium]|nr:formylglycine-generating enzyme family protein [Gemmatimonadota bacterium]